MEETKNNVAPCGYVDREVTAVRTLADVGLVAQTPAQLKAGAHGTRRPPAPAVPVLRRLTWVNLLDGLDTFEQARTLAGVFVATGDTPAAFDVWLAPFYGAMTTNLLAGCLLAAATGSLTVDAVLPWLQQEDVSEPARILDDAHPEVADLLRTTHAVGENTRLSIFFSAEAAFMAGWGTPSDTDPGAVGA